MDIVAKLRYLRIAPRKVRLVLDLIRGQSVTEAATQLLHLPKSSSRPLLKLLKSAEANAAHNFKLDPKTLVIKHAYADEGPKLKRYTPRAMGRATPLLKRLSHVTIILAARPTWSAKPAMTGHNASPSNSGQPKSRPKRFPAPAQSPSKTKVSTVRKEK
ncbi:MAG: 50S ribosomal protein L22 [Candidatus Kerfeldbacteria bacterium]|nr:50S ribosomal protein L22 [Candidatus Kerfeldbacteria bacterium]